jgi:hypothetical protein
MRRYFFASNTQNLPAHFTNAGPKFHLILAAKKTLFSGYLVRDCLIPFILWIILIYNHLIILPLCVAV